MREAEPLVVAGQAAQQGVRQEVAADGVLEPRVGGAAIDAVGEAELPQAGQPLELGRVDHRDRQRAEHLRAVQLVLIELGALG